MDSDESVGDFMTLLEDAIILAVNAHLSQVDKQGQPYILHCLAIMLDLSLTDDDDRVCAVLHDIIEDTYYTLDWFRCNGYPDHIVEVLDDLTRRKDETYPTYIKRVKVRDRSRRVKIADLRHNLSRISGLTERDRSRLQPRYEVALSYLEE